MRYGEYLVTGQRRYRGHEPGSTFEAALNEGAEQRAIGRGDIRLLRHIHPSILAGSLTLPDDWPPTDVPSHANHDAPEGASIVRGGG